MHATSINPTTIFQRAEIGNVRTAQEDNCVNGITPNGHLFVVCDGMGGHVGGAEASKIGVETIFEFLNRETYENILHAIDDALQFANAQILGKVYEYPALKGMGTTVCVLLLQENKAYIAHVGDSRIYLYLGREKELHRITKDHSFVQTLVDLPEGHPEKISDEEAEDHPDKNRILKALGIKSVLTPTICEKPLLPKDGDIFLLCSDGLSGMLPDSTIKRVLSVHTTTLDEKGDMLVNLALEAGGVDNITLQLVQISGSPHKKSAYKHCDCNPKRMGKSKSFVPRSKNTKLVKWIVCVCTLLFLAGGGGWYGYEKNAKMRVIRDLERKISEIDVKIKEHNRKRDIINEDLDTGRKATSTQNELRRDVENIEGTIEELKKEKEEISKNIIEIKSTNIFKFNKNQIKYESNNSR